MRIVVVGEAMVELRKHGEAWQIGYGGDTLNIAVHLARFGHNTAYMTALGTDMFSDDIRRALGAENLDISLVLTDGRRLPGLYAIRTDDMGERSFLYWRNNSAVTKLFELDGATDVIERAAQADILCLSLISLAVLSREGRGMLFELCHRVRARGGRVIFDGNYRPALWTNAEEARKARDTAIGCCDFGLPTLGDEIALGAPDDPQQIINHWSNLGAGEVIVKLGADGCFMDGRVVPTPCRLHPVDTSGAGDAFDAGYLHARVTGADKEQAAIFGHVLAGWVIMQSGAIPAVDPIAPYGATVVIRDELFQL